VLRDIRYLGVQLDTRLSFGAHVGKVAASARKAAVALGRLMPNVGGPSQSKRSLLMSVVHSRLLYGAPTWAVSASASETNIRRLNQAQSSDARRVARCYRTVSDQASLVLAKMVPAHLLALEREALWQKKKSGDTTSKSSLRRETIV
jgi:hypothetical protein